MEDGTIARRIRVALAWTGLGSSEAADACGIRRSQFSAYLSGSKTPSAKVVARISEGTGVTSDYLLGLSDEPFPAAGRRAYDPGLSEIVEVYSAANRPRRDEMRSYAQFVLWREGGEEGRR